jgi:murein DD-endopeptidase MepM/ murein hydrolase activator NlpD
MALLCACAHRRAVVPDEPAPHDIKNGVFHRVGAGETLYRIGRAYGVPVEQLQRENAIHDPAQLEVGSLLFVPSADHAVEVPGPDAPLARIEPRPQRRASPAQIPRAGGGALDPAAHGDPLAWPLRGVLISGFGMRDRDQHEGIDLAAPEGTAVLAAEAGSVLFAGEQRGYGNLVLLGHDRGLVTVYAHNAANLVSAGDRVERGQPIARVGRTGKATGPHLHFEVRVGARPRDPLGFLR